MIAKGSFNRRLRIERPVDDTALLRGPQTWEPVATVWASVMDALPSRGERLAEGLNVTTRPARVRMRYRTDVTAAMRLVELRWDAAEAKLMPTGRTMQIITVPAELGRREALEMMVEDFSPAVASANG